MTELEFQDQNKIMSSFRAREASPVSVFFTLESNFSIFSFSSPSVDRVSFASDTESISETSQDLVGHDSEENSSCTNPDVKKHTVELNNCYIYKKVDKAKVHKEDDETEVYCENDDAFSLALIECQEKSSRSDVFLKKSDGRRHASLDLNNHVAENSPKFGALKKKSTPRRSSFFQSPGTPNYRYTGKGMQKGCSSERVSLPHNVNKRHVSAALFPFSNGRTLPSKWEDAERWIFSPVPGDNIARPSCPPLPQRRPKAKSGPLGPPGVAYYSLYSPAMPMFEARNVGNLMHDSPFSAGVIMTNSLENCGGLFPPQAEPSIVRSASVHGCSESLGRTIDSHDKLEAVMDAATNISRDVSRNMSTCMSPEDNTHTSSKSLTSTLPIVELQNDRCTNSDARDVRVDEGVTVTRWAKKHKALINGRRSSDSVDDWTKKSVEAQSSVWELSETCHNISRIEREDARITAWENLQKAKAEAALHKLEAKLEKKRSSSMNKIMKKLKSAQKKVQEMRKTSNGSRKFTGRSHRALLFRRPRQISSLSGCFTCHAL